MNSKGLNTQQVIASRNQWGANIQESSGNKLVTIVTDVLKEPMVLLLMVTCLFYFFMGENREGVIMLLAILMVAGISVFQQVRSNSAVTTLNKYTKEPVLVMRNGSTIQIDAEELVKGDVMQVKEGQLINADAQIIEANDFFTDEAILTGESMAVDKNATNANIYSGTTATSGAAWTEVTAVGKNTRIGQMGILMDETLKQKTPLQNQVSGFVKKMTYFGLAAFLIVWGFNFSLTGDVLDSLLGGLTLAMAVLPEEIPVAMATFMALGAYRLIKKNILAKHPQTVEALGAATVICLDKTGTITENKMKVSGFYDFKSDELCYGQNEKTSVTAQELLKISMLASEDDPFDPMEQAIHEKYRETVLTNQKFTKTNEYPLSGKHPMMTHIFSDEAGNRIIATKGAPEGIISLSGLTDESQEKIKHHLAELASKGNRVLAVAKGIYKDGELPDDQHDFNFEFLGLIALSDPVKKNIKNVVQQFYESGIDVKMITGDYPATAISIAKQIELHHSNKYITGKEIEELNDTELQKAVAENSVFTRVMPETKLKIINSLKSIGEVVAMTGDGVNDGPALKAAHIGVSMGQRGSAIARNASSLVLIDDDLSSMTQAITFGRNIYSNLKKAIQYIIGIHIPLISIVTIPLILNWKFPHLFSPIHVIFLELIMGPTCSIVYENEPLDKRLSRVKPRKITDSLFTWSELSRSVIQGIVISIVLLSFTFYWTGNGESEVYIRTKLFSSLIFANIFLTLTGRSTTETILKTIHYKNYLVPVIIFVTVGFLICALLIPSVQAIFLFTGLSFVDLVLCAGIGMVSVIWIEVWKFFMERRLNRSS